MNSFVSFAYNSTISTYNFIVSTTNPYYAGSYRITLTALSNTYEVSETYEFTLKLSYTNNSYVSPTDNSNIIIPTNTPPYFSEVLSDMTIKAGITSSY